MTTTRLEYIKKQFDGRCKQAEKIMDGGENYDGADGARYVLELCDLAEELIKEIVPNDNQSK